MQTRKVALVEGGGEGYETGAARLQHYSGSGAARMHSKFNSQLQTIIWWSNGTALHHQLCLLLMMITEFMTLILTPGENLKHPWAVRQGQLSSKRSQNNPQRAKQKQPTQNEYMPEPVLAKGQNEENKDETMETPSNPIEQDNRKANTMAVVHSEA